jgi:hypothetical protein
MGDTDAQILTLECANPLPVPVPTSTSTGSEYQAVNFDYIFLKMKRPEFGNNIY